MGKIRTDQDSETLVDDKVELEEPSLFRVILLNDDYTHQNFVVDILVTIFRKSIIDAERIMLTVHLKGQGLCGVYPKQIAEAKADMVHQRARAEGFPLRCVIEET